MTDIIRDAAMGKEDTVAMLEKLIALAASGEIQCMAMRLFKSDGTFEDVAIGGTEEEQADVLAKMRQQT